jgi:hypothetical protein
MSSFSSNLRPKRSDSGTSAKADLLGVCRGNVRKEVTKRIRQYRYPRNASIVQFLASKLAMRNSWYTRTWTIDVQKKKSWRVERRPWRHLIGHDSLFQKTPMFTPKKRTVKSGDALENTVF